jgi:hypothetical protein
VARYRLPTVVAIIAYAMVAAFALRRFFPSGIAFPIPGPLWLQADEGFINGTLLGAFYPVTILTPALFLVAQRRSSVSVAFFVLCAVAGFVAVYLGSVLGYVKPDEFTPFWGATISAVVNAPALVALMILMWALSKRTRKVRPS